MNRHLPALLAGLLFSIFALGAGSSPGGSPGIQRITFEPPFQNVGQALLPDVILDAGAGVVFCTSVNGYCSLPDAGTFVDQLSKQSNIQGDKTWKGDAGFARNVELGGALFEQGELTLASRDGTSSSDFAITAGTTVAESSVDPGAEIFGIYSGLFGSPVEKLAVKKNGVTIFVDAGIAGSETVGGSVTSLAIPNVSLHTCNFCVPNNPAASSPALANYNNALELGGKYPFPSAGAADVYLGAMQLRDGGYILIVLNNYGAPGGGSEEEVFKVGFQGRGELGENLYVGQFQGDGRVISQNGDLYLMGNGELILWNNSGSGNMRESYVDPGGTLLETLDHSGNDTLAGFISAPHGLFSRSATGALSVGSSGTEFFGIPSGTSTVNFTSATVNLTNTAISGDSVSSISMAGSSGSGTFSSGAGLYSAGSNINIGFFSPNGAPVASGGMADSTADGIYPGSYGLLYYSSTSGHWSVVDQGGSVTETLCTARNGACNTTTGDLTVNGDAGISGSESIGKNLTVFGDAGIAGNAQVGGSFNVFGTQMLQRTNAFQQFSVGTAGTSYFNVDNGGNASVLADLSAASAHVSGNVTANALISTNSNSVALLCAGANCDTQITGSYIGRGLYTTSDAGIGGNLRVTVAPLEITGESVNNSVTLSTSVPSAANFTDIHINSINTRTDGNRMSWDDQGTPLAWIDNIGDGIFNASIRLGLSKVEGLIGTLDLQANRAANDPSTDFRFVPKTGVTRDFGNLYAEWDPTGAGVVSAAIGTRGEVYGGGQTSAAGDFVSLQGDPAHPTLTCNGGVGGCYLILSGGMLDTNNGAFHGIVTIGNGGPQTIDGGTTVNPFRDGGLWLQGQGTGAHFANGGTFPHTLTAADDFGDWWFRDGYLTSNVDSTDQRVCESALVWDGKIHNSAGAFAFIMQNDKMNLCTAASAAGDGGYEHLVTDLNAASLLGGGSGAFVDTSTNQTTIRGYKGWVTDAGIGGNLLVVGDISGASVTATNGRIVSRNANGGFSFGSAGTGFFDMPAGTQNVNFNGATISLASSSITDDGYYQATGAYPSGTAFYAPHGGAFQTGDNTWYGISGVTNSASNIAFRLNSNTTLSAANTQLLSIQNGGTEVCSVTRDATYGDYIFTIPTPASTVPAMKIGTHFISGYAANVEFGSAPAVDDVTLRAAGYFVGGGTGSFDTSGLTSSGTYANTDILMGDGTYHSGVAIRNTNLDQTDSIGVKLGTTDTTPLATAELLRVGLGIGTGYRSSVVADPGETPYLRIMGNGDIKLNGYDAGVIANSAPIRGFPTISWPDDLNMDIAPYIAGGRHADLLVDGGCCQGYNYLLMDTIFIAPGTAPVYIATAQQSIAPTGFLGSGTQGADVLQQVDDQVAIYTGVDGFLLHLPDGGPAGFPIQYNVVVGSSATTVDAGQILFAVQEGVRTVSPTNLFLVKGNGDTHLKTGVLVTDQTDTASVPGFSFNDPRQNNNGETSFVFTSFTNSGDHLVFDWQDTGASLFSMLEDGSMSMADPAIASGVPNGASAKAFILNSVNYTTTGAKLLSVQNNTAEKASIDKDGYITSITPVTLQTVGFNSYTAINIQISAYKLPPRAFTIDAINMVATAGSSGSHSNSVFEISDGTNKCDCTFDCNTGISGSATRTTCSGAAGTGCAYAASTNFNYQFTTVGGCTPNPTFVRELSIEGHWQ